MKRMFLASMLCLLTGSVLAEEADDYRPFVEDGKVWLVGNVWYTSELLELLHYYLDGDTIIDEQPCKRMMCTHEVIKEEWFSTPLLWDEYVGGVYEKDQRVYFYDPKAKQKEWILLYDFAATAGDTIEVYAGVNSQFMQAYYNKPTTSCIVMDKKRKETDYYNKGFVMNVAMQYLSAEEVPSYEDFTHQWMEGVGGPWIPIHNLIPKDWSGYNYQLISCYVDDEIIYYNKDIMKGLDPISGEPEADATTAHSKIKKKIDFTYTRKKRPMAPRRRTKGADTSVVTGEFNSKTLTIDLGTLSDIYEVSITDKNGQAVYQKQVRANHVLALDINIADYGNDDYTITLENDDESFTGQFNPADVTAINAVTTAAGNGNWYDLSGRRLHSVPTKGLYICNGRKVLLK